MLLGQAAQRRRGHGRRGRRWRWRPGTARRAWAGRASSASCRVGRGRRPRGVAARPVRRSPARSTDLGRGVAAVRPGGRPPHRRRRAAGGRGRRAGVAPAGGDAGPPPFPQRAHPAPLTAPDRGRRPDGTALPAGEAGEAGQHHARGERELVEPDAGGVVDGGHHGRRRTGSSASRPCPGRPTARAGRPARARRSPPCGGCRRCRGSGTCENRGLTIRPVADAAGPRRARSRGPAPPPPSIWPTTSVGLIALPTSWC